MTNSTKQNAYGVIMAGGSGTRFWPLSRAEHPKQLLKLAGEDATLLGATCERLEKLLPRERILVVTSARLAEQTRKELSQLPPENILAEPVGRNTAPCVGWAAARVARDDPDAVMVVVPADHHIGDEATYQRVLTDAINAAHEGHMVTVGIRPTRAETGYGYIEMDDPIHDEVHRARRFVEKPNEARARQFLAAGHFLWNSGMFFFKASVVLDAIQQHLPGLSDQLKAYDAAADKNEEQALIEATYASLPDVSIDHGLMEKVDDVAVIPADFGWSDLGSWTTAWELSKKDGDGNAMVDESSICVDSKGCYVRAPQGKIVAIVGLEGVVVVDTEDALLVVPRERSQDVRAVVQALRDRRDEKHL